MTLTHNVPVPETSMPVAVVEVLAFIDGDGDEAWGIRVEGTESTIQILGLLEWAKHHIANNGDVDEWDDT